VVQVRDADGDRNEENRHHRQHARGGTQNPANDHAPLAAGSWWIIASASGPTVAPSTSMYAIRYDWKNWPGS